MLSYSINDLIKPLFIFVLILHKHRYWNIQQQQTKLPTRNWIIKLFHAYYTLRLLIHETQTQKVLFYGRTLNNLPTTSTFSLLFNSLFQKGRTITYLKRSIDDNSIFSTSSSRTATSLSTLIHWIHSFLWNWIKNVNIFTIITV